VGNQYTVEIADVIKHLPAFPGERGTDASSGAVPRPDSVPLPSLAFEYLLGADSIQLGAVYGIAGPPSSFKSTLALDLARLVLECGGVGALCSTEGLKINVPMASAILGDRSSRMLAATVDCVEDAQQFLSSVIDWAGAYIGRDGNSVVIVLDSLFGCPSKRTRERIARSGFATKGFPHEAHLWDSWLPNVHRRLKELPVLFLIVNHAKRDFYGPSYDSKRHPGGAFQDIYAEVYVHTEVRAFVERADDAVSHIAITTAKCRRGEIGRTIDVPFVVEKGSGRMYFDWAHATAHLLSQKPSYRHRDVLDLSGIVDVDASSSSLVSASRTFTSRRLDLTAVPGRVIGEAVHANTGLMDELRDALGIRRLRAAADDEEGP